MIIEEAMMETKTAIGPPTDGGGDCPVCRPTRVSLAPGDAAWAINRVWSMMTAGERRAFHRVACLRSRADDDLRVMRDYATCVEWAGRP